MEVITREEHIKNVPKMWKLQYPGGKEGIYEKLLDAKPLTKEKVDAIIGNESWTRLSCDECEKDVDIVVIFSDSETSRAICKKCITKASRKIIAHAKGK
jgi:hypothetical protein